MTNIKYEYKIRNRKMMEQVAIFQTSRMQKRFQKHISQHLPDMTEEEMIERHISFTPPFQMSEFFRGLCLQLTNPSEYKYYKRCDKE